MQHGDIDNTPPQRLLVVFEGLIGLRESGDAPARRRSRLLRRAEARLRPEDFTVNPGARDAIWRETHHTGWHVDVLTFLGDAFAYELAEWLPGQMVHAPVISRTPEALARELAHRGDILAVYSPVARHILTFGHVGRHLQPWYASEIGRR